MNKDVFILANWLLEQHKQCDRDLSQEKLQCKLPDGTLTGLEFDKEPYYKNGLRYIGLGMYQTLWDTPTWKEAYTYLVEQGFLKENPEHAHHYMYIPFNVPEFINKYLTPNKLSVPPELRTKYNAYLKSDEWKNKAEFIFARDGHKCTKCGSTHDLNCHHLTYENLFHEKDEDLITLCRECHEKVHEIK